MTSQQCHNIPLIFLLILLLLCSCARRQADPADLDEFYVILPGNFIIDLAAGAKVWLNPDIQEFALFRTPAKAQEALIASKEPGDWAIYKVSGNEAEIAGIRPDGQYRLNKQVQLEDWVKLH